VMTIIDEASQLLAYSHRWRSRPSSSPRRSACSGPEPEGTRPPEGRFHLDRDAEAAHAPHVDPRAFRDPATIRTSTGRSASIHGARHQESERLTRLINGARPREAQSASPVAQRGTRLARWWRTRDATSALQKGSCSRRGRAHRWCWATATA
jgi:hypothetical protein